MLVAGTQVCRQAAAGLGMNDLCIRWSNQTHSVEDCYNIMFPHDYFNHVLDLTNANLPVSVRNFTKHEFMQCIGVLLTTALVNPGNIKNLLNMQESRLVPPFRLKERFVLGRDRFQDWKAHLQLAVPRSREDAQKDPWYRKSVLLFSLHVQSGSQSFILTGDPNPLVVPTPSSKPKLSASHANLPSVKASGKDLWLNTQCRR